MDDMVHQPLVNLLNRVRYSQLSCTTQLSSLTILSDKLVSQEGWIQIDWHSSDISQVRLKEQAGVDQPILLDCLSSSNDSTWY